MDTTPPYDDLLCAAYTDCADCCGDVASGCVSEGRVASGYTVLEAYAGLPADAANPGFQIGGERATCMDLRWYCEDFAAIAVACPRTCSTCTVSKTSNQDERECTDRPDDESSGLTIGDEVAKSRRALALAVTIQVSRH